MKSIIGNEKVRKEAVGLLYDESRFTAGVPSEVHFPESIEDCRRVCAAAFAQNRPITLIGGQTGIAGGSVPTEDSIALCFNAMNRILGAGAAPDGAPVLYCQPGVTIDAIAAFCDAPLSLPYAVKNAEQLEPGAWFYPPDPTETTAQLGGTVAANASGARTFRFGPTRAHIESLLVILADGNAATLQRGQYHFSKNGCCINTEKGAQVVIPPLPYLSPPIKNASGYFSAPGMDCIDLFVGSEGTLGIFTEIGIRLSPRPSFIGGLSFFGSRNGAFAFADFLRKQPRVSAIEYFDATALEFIEKRKDAISLALPALPPNAQAALYWECMDNSQSPFEEQLESWEERLAACDSSLDATWSGFEPQERKRLKSFRHAVPELVNFTIAQYKKSAPNIRKIGTDTAAPGDHFEAMFEKYRALIKENKLTSVIFGHLGDYHLHFNLLPQNEGQLQTCLGLYRRMMTIAAEYGGVISAEHGIGKAKAAYLSLMYSEEALAAMKSVKKALDPKWLLSPGNLFEITSYSSSLRR
jgi:D-lactate dehydrogenase (cytochrome)